MKKILIPYECGAGGSTPGAENGPRYLYHAGLAERIGASWIREPKRHSPFTQKDNIIRRSVVLEHTARITLDIAEVIKAGNYPITIAGDHSNAAGSIRGFAESKSAHGRIGVLWVDAHLDMNMPETSLSGSYHGMPLAALLGYGDPQFCGLKTVLDPCHVCILGARDIDPPEATLAKKMGVRIIEMSEIQNKGLAACMAEAIEHIGQGTDYKIMSFDLDALWPHDFALATGTPVLGGIDPNAMLESLRAVPMGTFDMVELVELNPELGDAGKTADLAINLLAAVLP